MATIAQIIASEASKINPYWTTGKVKQYPIAAIADANRAKDIDKQK